MDMKRRTFLKNSAVLAGSAAALGVWSCTQKAAETAAVTEAGPWLTGVQLYSIREDMKNDPLGTLKLLAEMGYKHVEHAGYREGKFYGYAPAEFKKILDDLGMTMPSGHTVLRFAHWDNTAKDFNDEWKKTVEDAATAGQTYVISPSMEESVRTDINQLNYFMEIFNKSGELCQKYNMKYGYHNHDFEFSESLEGKTLYDHILEKTDPSMVMQQLDTGNLYNGGAKAIDIVKKWPGRFESMHVKDEIKSTDPNAHDEYESTILGEGIVNVKEVIDLGKANGGTLHFIIEQESYQGKTALECVKRDLEIMKSWGY